MPTGVLNTFNKLVTVSLRHSMGVMFVVALDSRKLDDPKIVIQFSPHTSLNPAIAQMCEDVGEMLRELAGKFREAKETTN